MKRILFQAAFMLLSTTVSAQDVIVKKNGEEIRAKVEEVGEQSIRYRKFTNLMGPVYSIARGEVFVIRYESGAKDIITPLDRSAAAGKTQDTGIAAPSQQAMRHAAAHNTARYRNLTRFVFIFEFCFYISRESIGYILCSGVRIDTHCTKLIQTIAPNNFLFT